MLVVCKLNASQIFLIAQQNTDASNEQLFLHSCDSLLIWSWSPRRSLRWASAPSPRGGTFSAASQSSGSVQQSVLLVRLAIFFLQKGDSWDFSLHLFRIEIKTEIMWILQCTHMLERQMYLHAEVCVQVLTHPRSSTPPSAALVCLRQQSFQIVCNTISSTSACDRIIVLLCNCYIIIWTV